MQRQEIEQRLVELVDALLHRARNVGGIFRHRQRHAERVLEDQVVGVTVPGLRTAAQRLAVGRDFIRPVLKKEAPETGGARPAVGPEDGGLFFGIGAPTNQ